MLGTQELILIIIVALFLFGPNKIPEIAHSIGKAVGEFKKAQIESERELQIHRPSKDSITKIHNLAIDMGIDVKNKTTEQLVEEIRLAIRSKETLPVEQKIV